MLEQQTCWVAICDTCGEPARSEHRAHGVAHFDSQADALDALDTGELRARLAEDGDIECGPCHHIRQCAQTGHTWSKWQPRAIWPGRFRLCRTCQRLDYRPTSTQEVTR